MKKILTLFGICMCLVSCSCSTTSREYALIERSISYENTEKAMSKYDYSEYYNAKGMKGTEVYIWKILDNVWRCGARIGTNRLASLEELQFMQKELPCSLPKMKEILSTYSEEERKNIAVVSMPYPITEENYNPYNFQDGQYDFSELVDVMTQLGLIIQQ